MAETDSLIVSNISFEIDPGASIFVCDSFIFNILSRFSS